MRNREEAIIALRNGVEILDVKEPSEGALGRADVETLRAIVESVATWNGAADAGVMVTAAWGELREFRSIVIPAIVPGVAAIKVGFAGEKRAVNLANRFQHFAARYRSSVDVVPVAYADDEVAEAPTVMEIVELAIESRAPMVLIDTFGKGNGGLWDRLDRAQWRRIRETCREAGIGIALAGSLTAERLGYEDAPPDVVGIRGAACVKGMRTKAISGERIEEFKRMLAEYSERYHVAPDVVGR